MSEDYSSGGSTQVAGILRSPQDITVHELLTTFGPSPSRDPAFLHRHPISPEEFEKLKENARKAQKRASRQTMEITAREDTSSSDVDEQSTAMNFERPEGQISSVSPQIGAPVATRSFRGIPQTAFRPPDCTLAAGLNDVMLAVNTDLAIYTKAGALRFRWANMSLFNPVLPQGASVFDPKLAYDHYQNRWIVVAAARRANPAGSWIMIGVSQSSDPAGSYWIWALDATLDGGTPSSNWADFPTLGFDTQGIYICCNMFQFNGGFRYSKLRILQKAELYSGGSGPSHFAKWYDFWNLKNPDNSVTFTIQPAVHFRGVGGNPPAYLVNTYFPSGNSLVLWTLNNPVGYWIGGNPSLTRTPINCISYSLPPQARQLGTSVSINTDDSRLLNAIHQHSQSGEKRLWTCHTSNYTWQGDAEAVSVVQWYEIDLNSNTVIQQNRYGAAGKYYYYPAIQTDLSRNAYVVFSRSGASEYAHLRQTGRRVSSPLNDLENSALVKAGESSYTGGRWGDYFGVCRDPADLATVWLYGEYSASGNTWGTWVSSARF